MLEAQILIHDQTLLNVIVDAVQCDIEAINVEQEIGLDHAVDYHAVVLRINVYSKTVDANMELHTLQELPEVFIRLYLLTHLLPLMLYLVCFQDVVTVEIGVLITPCRCVHINVELLHWVLDLTGLLAFRALVRFVVLNSGGLDLLYAVLQFLFLDSFLNFDKFDGRDLPGSSPESDIPNDELVPVAHHCLPLLFDVNWKLLAWLLLAVVNEGLYPY